VIDVEYSGCGKLFISSFHSSQYQDESLLAYCSVQTRRVTAIIRAMNADEAVTTSEMSINFYGLHGALSQKNVIWVANTKHAIALWLAPSLRVSEPRPGQ
jgi:hypothetical protein